MKTAQENDMKISKQQFKAALDRAYEAGITYTVQQQYNLDYNTQESVIKRIVKHEVEHAKARKHWNVNSTTQRLAAQETLRAKMPSTLDDLLADFNFDDEVTSNCKKCNAEIKNGGDWGHCTCCYEVTRAQEEQDDEA
jgi:hypothetical protein